MTHGHTPTALPWKNLGMTSPDIDDSAANYLMTFSSPEYLTLFSPKLTTVLAFTV